MNIFQEAYLALKFEKWLSAEIKEAKQMTGTTPGWKTSEFWLTLMATLGSLYGSVQGFVPAPWNVIVPAVGVAVYTIARTLLKANATPPSTTTS